MSDSVKIIEERLSRFYFDIGSPLEYGTINQEYADIATLLNEIAAKDKQNKRADYTIALIKSQAESGLRNRVEVFMLKDIESIASDYMSGTLKSPDEALTQLDGGEGEQSNIASASL